MKEILKYFLMVSTGLYVVYFIYVVVDKGIKVKQEISGSKSILLNKNKSEQESDIDLRKSNKEWKYPMKLFRKNNFIGCFFSSKEKYL